MAEMRDLSLSVRVFMKAYPWRKIDPVPWTPMRKPLSESTLALVSTAGMVGPGQEPFDNDVRGGDFSFRMIAPDTDVSTLIDTHRSESFDHSGIERDPNLGFPLDRLREIEERGVIKRLAPRHLSFMGSITAPGRLMRDTAPEAARMLVADGVDAALLVPV
jgi:D-proline reductase (dithiol) PrdB